MEAFAPSACPALRRAVADLSWLLSRSYADKSALKLVGDRFTLTQRQRMAVMRCACADDALTYRRNHQTFRGDAAGGSLLVDGYNALTTVEAGLAGGVIIAGRDGCYRDMASMHGTFRQVEETAPALALLGRMLAEMGAARCVWYLDSPVSNSGRLKQAMLATSRANDWNWEVQVVPNPDAILVAAADIVCTADSVILDRCQRWLNLARETVTRCLPEAWLVDLSTVGEADAADGPP